MSWSQRTERLQTNNAVNEAGRGAPRSERRESGGASASDGATKNLNIDQIQILSAQLLAGDRRALARAISIAEDGGDQALQLTRLLHAHAGKAHIIGITGAPGAGKSTLADGLIGEIRRCGLKVGVLAIDPSSPFTGGAILGDRIRMQRHTLDQDVFIRSMANRGQAGGLAPAVYDAERMLAAAGFNVILIETVGVGQSELAIAKAADTTILVAMPGSGDDIQAIKSGIMEIGDIFVVNKGDLPGANKTAAEIASSLELNNWKDSWRAPVIVASAETGAGVDKIWQAAQDHYKFLVDSALLETKRQEKVKSELADLVAEQARQSLKSAVENSEDAQLLLRRIANRQIDPHSAAEQLIDNWFGKRPKS